MRLLILDHYFGQDIEALRGHAAPGDDLRVISFDRLRSEAMRIFPEAVAHGIEAYAAPELEPQRRAWARRLARLLEAEFSRGPFDALVLPSDTFFYVRESAPACHALGAPLITAQKETTISPETMRSHAPKVGRFAPPVSDLMTVCSERHREFWLRAGGDAERIVVTGQPRFDVYVGGVRAPEERTVLFLSYMPDAYHPTDGQGLPYWRDLHRETEDGLWELARRGWQVVVKPHPQQVWRDERRRLERVAPPGVVLADPEDDVRELILRAAVVVGFQTTAMLEALAADRPVVYTAWSPEAADLGDALIPFDRWPDVTTVRAAGELVGAIEDVRGRRQDAAARARVAAIVDEQLGPVDGHASERTLAVIRACVEQSVAARSPQVVARRETLERRRPPLEVGRKVRAGVRRLRGAIGA